ncbi:MAG: tetratricopeptide repeat protein, partial [Acidobacteria bacterium]|nr:tetratricopeptide repeat protein [Acidobacteriota bacterium]
MATAEGFGANGRGRAGARPEPVLPDAIREALDRVLGSTALRHTDRLKRFLRFVVERTLDGRGSELKEYVVGVEVFERPASFDPRADPVVRVEARRLRFKLHDYYESEGGGDPVVIDLPKGSYVPAFRVRPSPGGLATGTATAVAAGSATAGSGPVSRRRFARRTVLIALSAAVFALGGVAVYLAVTAGARRAAAVPTIAVLPFENVSADPDNEHFCFGMVEELTTALAQVEGVRVVARTSSSQFRVGKDVTEIGRQLHANLIVEGSVRKSGDRLRVTAQLINAVDGSHVWAHTFERTVRDVFATQDEISLAITEALKRRVVVPGAARASRRSPRDPDAYTLFLKGQYFRNRLTPDDVHRGIDYLSQAIARDPGFAPAHAELAAAYSSLAFNEAAPPEREMALAKAEARKALALDSTRAEAHALLAWIAFFYDWNWPEAARGFARALELNPNLAEAYHRYAILLMAERRFDDALELSRKALDLDPLSPRISANRGLILFCARRYDEAIRQARQALELAPQYALAHIYIGSSHAMQGRYGQAFQAYRAALAASPGDPDATASLARAYALDGQREQALALIRDLEDPARPAPASRYQLAFAHAAL